MPNSPVITQEYLSCCWPGGSQYVPEIVIGRASHDLKANEEIWDFFEAESGRP